MNKKTFVKRYFGFLNDTGLEAHQVRVGFGGVLLMLELRRTTNDLDLELTAPHYHVLKEKYQLKTVPLGPEPYTDELAIWNDHIDLHLEDHIANGLDVEGVWVTMPYEVLRLKKLLNRPKDQVDIHRLERLLS